MTLSISMFYYHIHKPFQNIVDLHHTTPQDSSEYVTVHYLIYWNERRQNGKEREKREPSG